MSPLLRCLCIAIGLLAASVAHAERFDVSVRVFCPASWNEAADRLDTSFTTAVDRPCAGIRVVAMDADPLWDEFCGAAYTDSRGMARFRAECGDSAGGRPEVYLKVEGRSVNGFSVGLLDINLFDRLLDSLIRSITGGALPPIVQDVDELRSHRTFEWLFAPARLVSDDQTLDLGDVAIGGSFSVAVSGVPVGSSEGGAVSQMAARQFWAAQYSMHRLRAGTQYRPMDFNYTVSHPIGTPTTLYDTVVVSHTNNEGEEAAKALRATPHEIGHVLYNTYHSGILHWLGEAPHYMVNHSRCDDDHTLRLAWYEGFAHFVRDYVFQQWDWNVSNWTNEHRPYQGCAFEADAPEEDGRGQPGMHIEGNVQALLNNVFFGPVRQEQRNAIGVRLPEEFTCPAGQRRIVTSIGSVECEREVPVTCAAGVYTIDGRGNTDQCARKVRDASCQAFEECEPVDQLNAATCSSGRAVRRSGPDACLVTSPAMDALNGAPRPRPDGSPDMVIGRSTNEEGRDWFALPSLDQVMQWVIAAGHDGHRAREFWEQWIRPSCLPRIGVRYQYCRPDQSPSFLDEIQKLDQNLN